MRASDRRFCYDGFFAEHTDKLGIIELPLDAGHQ